MLRENDIKNVRKLFNRHHYVMTTAELLEAKLYYADIKQLLDDGFIATTSTAEQWEKNKFTSKGYDPKYIIVGNSQEFDFGKCGITFETPPPENAVITMDAILDLPYKDTDIIMTMSLEVEQPNPEEGAI